jgi:hypothetical protein
LEVSIGFGRFAGKKLEKSDLKKDEESCDGALHPLLMCVSPGRDCLST